MSQKHWVRFNGHQKLYRVTINGNKYQFTRPADIYRQVDEKDLDALLSRGGFSLVLNEDEVKKAEGILKQQSESISTEVKESREKAFQVRYPKRRGRSKKG